MHLTMLLRAGDTSADLIIAVIGWTLAVLVFEAERGTARGVPASAAGAGLLLVGFGILQCARMTVTDLWFLKILAPLLFAGVLLGCQGWRGAAMHWRSGALILIMAAPEKCLPWVDYGGALTIAHAGTAGFALHCIGMDVAVHGNVIMTRAGAVQVEEACSGMVMMMMLFKLAVMLCLALRLRLWKSVLTCAGALLAGFATGTLRVCVLAALVNRPWFETLHGPTGMNLFPLIGFLLFAPFLFHAEEPFEKLLWQAWCGFRSATPPASGYMATMLALIATGYCLCFVAGDRLQPGGANSPIGFPFMPTGFLRLAVPDNLLNRRFNTVSEARLWNIEKSGTSWNVLGCAVSNAVLGPEDLAKDPEFARFAESEFSHFAPAQSIGIDAGSRTFLTTAEFNAAQRATAMQLNTWIGWLKTGRPLKDCRYDLFVTVAGQDKPTRPSQR